MSNAKALTVVSFVALGVLNSAFSWAQGMQEMNSQPPGFQPRGLFRQMIAQRWKRRARQSIMNGDGNKGSGLHSISMLKNLTPQQAGVVEKSIESGGIVRTYYVHVPAANSAAANLPVVLCFHGGGGTALGMTKISGMNSAADHNGFIVVYPQGINKGWNDGRPVRQGRGGANDVQFVSDLLRTLESEYNIDQSRIYATGLSNGGFFSQRLALELSRQIAAVGTVAASVSEEIAANRANSEPVPIMLILGTADPLVPFAGGHIKWTVGEVLSGQASLEFWRLHNGCQSQPHRTSVQNTDANDGATAVQEYYAGPGGADVALITVHGGGHTWPRGLQYLPISVVGQTCNDFDCCETLWQFFSQHPKKKAPTSVVQQG